MLDITIRLMCEEDLDIVADYAMLANPHAERESYKKGTRDELKRNPNLSFVALKCTKLVGYVQGDFRGSIGILEDLAIDREHQGLGIGGQLLLVELEALRKKGCKVVMAEVHYKNARAIPFYYKYNFRIHGCAQDYFGLGHDTIMLKTLL